ncbi:N/A [soil metagenome]
MKITVQRFRWEIFGAGPWLRACFAMVGLGLFSVLFSSCASSPKSTTYVPQEPPERSDIYVLRVGDIVQVDVFQEPGMTTRQRIQGDGTISVGLIGRVTVLGDSVQVAGQKIAKLLDQKFLVNPQVTVTVLAYSPRRFTVWGQVQRPGSYVIPPEQSVSLPEAISMAGGNSNIGNLKRVQVSRNDHGAINRKIMNALSPAAQDFHVKEGDVIFVTETVF